MNQNKEVEVEVAEILREAEESAFIAWQDALIAEAEEDGWANTAEDEKRIFDLLGNHPGE